MEWLSKSELREKRKTAVLADLRAGHALHDALIRNEVFPSVFISWKRQDQHYSEMVDDAISGKEAHIYSSVLKKVFELAEQGNIEALKLMAKQVQGGARKAGYSGADKKESVVNIDNSDNRQINNLSALLSHDAINRLKQGNLQENKAEFNLTPPTQKVDCVSVTDYPSPPESISANPHAILHNSGEVVDGENPV